MALIFVNFNNLASYFEFFYIQSFVSGIRHSILPHNYFNFFGKDTYKNPRIIA